jgi:hypothetical protein
MNLFQTFKTILRVIVFSQDIQHSLANNDSKKSEHLIERYEINAMVFLWRMN